MIQKIGTTGDGKSAVATPDGKNRKKKMYTVYPTPSILDRMIQVEREPRSVIHVKRAKMFDPVG